MLIYKPTDRRAGMLGETTFLGDDAVIGGLATRPLDYNRLCKQTVTIYRKQDAGEGTEYLRMVIRRAFLDYKKTQSVDKTGSKDANSFILVVPGGPQAVFVGDKVYDGIGPEIADREAWASFIPTKVPGLVVVSYADPKKWNGQIVHTEAGG